MKVFRVKKEPLRLKSLEKLDENFPKFSSFEVGSLAHYHMTLLGNGANYPTNVDSPLELALCSSY